MMQASTHTFHIYSLSERAVTIEFGNEISEDTLQRISSFNQSLRQKPFTGFYTSVAAYTTLSVFFNPLQVIAEDMLPGDDCFEKVSGYLKFLNNKPQREQSYPSKTITIPVCYGGPLGWDLEEVAHVNKLSIEQVIELHSTVIYKVYMIGFVPGFAYMGGMSALIATPRKSTPQKAIPAGSVGIAGEQTGIYPLETPGGWQIIGQTPLKMFDANRTQPALLKAGDNVIFQPISEQVFNTLSDQ
jgi:inhibitor of KinA